MTDDGTILYNVSHPQPVWWKRPYWWFAQWRAGREMKKYTIVEEICINENTGEETLWESLHDK